MKKLFLGVLVAVFSLTIATSAAPANAQISIVGSIPEVTTNLLDKLKEVFSTLLKKTGSALMNSAVKNAVNTLAYEAANKVGAGMTGQKPMYEEKEWGDIFADTGNAAIGGFIDSMDEVWGVNLCEPDLSVKLKIGLGLKAQSAPPKPSCDWQTLSKNWDMEKLKGDFTKNFAVTFEPNNSDLGAARFLLNSMLEKEASEVADKKLETMSNQGWLNPRNIGGIAKTFPDNAKIQLEGSNQAYWNSMGKVTGDIFTDAANVFLNQLAITTYQGIMANLTEKSKDNSNGLADASADPSAGGGAAGVRSGLAKIVESRFDSRGDYDILGELSSCASTPGGVGPTNCVIDERMRQAIEQKKTVGQALKEGLLRSDAPFGFVSTGNGLEPNYLEGIPYRSMLILRKFRIIPVGWELAAQKIYSSNDAKKNAYLGKMVECYSKDDAYEGYWSDWCNGLVDPDWVLKAPQNYCAKEGYGPQVIFSQAVEQGSENVVTEKEDVDGDGILDTEDANGNKVLDSGEDINGNGVLDTEDVNGNGVLDEKNEIIKLPPKLIVNRLDGYCADEQSCIKEKADGSCEYYGYCTEERRKWSFGGDSCEPVFNTCQTFKGEKGESISYLKNTLDFCDASDYGCERYAKASVLSYSTTAKANNWSNNDGYSYFNKNAQECDADNEGCHEFLRIAKGVGTNLIRNSGFEQNQNSDYCTTMFSVDCSIFSPEESSASNPGAEPERFWRIKSQGGGGAIADDAPDRGGNVLRINSSVSPAGWYSPDRSAGSDYSVLPQGFVMEPEVSYTLSADIYNIDADRVVLAIGREGQYWEAKEITSQGSWVRESVTIRNNQDILANEIRIFGYGSSGVAFYIDNIKFEIGNKATAYNDYRQSNLVYERLLPIYLEPICYVDAANGDYRLKSDAPTECRQYARKCNRDEANCEMFTSTKDGAKLPAAVGDKDYCSAECNGFDSYVQSQNNFNSRQAFYFIPKTAAVCSAADVGCEEFTNLDKSEQGGESREYYSYLRQCVKPNTSGNTCASFYTWEGNNEQGEQLSLHNLKSDPSGDVSLTSSDLGLCSETIFNLAPTDLGYNPDCRKFYNQSGGVSYHLYSRTISCTEDCHPYRMSNKNVDPAITSSAACTGASRSWDSSINACRYCENGGTWSSEHQACIYNATPGESTACSASANGCSEFNGNQGNNVRQLLLDTFEAGSNSWNGGTVMSSAVSGLKSYQITSTVSRQVGRSVKQGGSYALSFIAKPTGSSDVQVSVSIGNGMLIDSFSANAETESSVTAKADEWNLYQLNLPVLNHEVTDSEMLIISISGGGVYLDNIKLTAITERYYLVRNSWKTPDSCNQDENGKPYPLYMLGCSEYKDRLGNIHYLHRFSRLCQESAVGCEAMIDTQNSTKQSSEYFSAGTGTLVPSDRVSYAVYDPDKKCKSTSKGCERFGLAKEYQNSYTYSDVFIKNDPDKYSSTLCSQEGVGCNKWAAADGDYYFKDPGDMVCEWRIGKLPSKSAPDWGWFKKKVKRCNGTDAVCSSNLDCAIGTCQLETTPDEDLACPVSSLKTFGQGGMGNEVFQPVEESGFNWVGLCSTDQSGCTEYIEPVSEFSSNLIYNADFRQDIDGNGVADGWTSPANGQSLFLEGGSLYALTVEGANMATVNVSSPTFMPFHLLSSDNSLLDPIGSFVVHGSSSVIFYLNSNAEPAVTVSSNDANNSSKIILRKVITDYQLTSDVDKKSCNGVANVGNGCVYFNERSVVGASGLSSLTKNAWLEYGKEINVGNPVNNVNQLIKVSPDRVCNTWLSCKTYTKGDDNKPVCFDIAECDRLDAGGNCANFKVIEPNRKQDRVYDPTDPTAENSETVKNASGYVKIAYAGVPTSISVKNWLPSDYKLFGLMEQDGEKVNVSNGNFEDNIKELNSNKNGFVYKPMGWSPANANWDSSSIGGSGMFQVITDPLSAQNFGIDYPAEGRAFLQYSPANSDNYPYSDAIRISTNKEYYLSFKINTTKLLGGSSKAVVQVLKQNGDVIGGWEFGSSLDWYATTTVFTSVDSNIVHLRLGASGSALGGYIYIDDIKISPVLKTKEDGSQWLASQSCKLYPKEDSLSCDYYDDAGIRLKGDLGYCLEYDRAPGDPNTCLLWWPIDKVSGQGEGKKSSSGDVKGYTGSAPLFYCVAAEDRRPYIDATQVFWSVDETISLTVNGVNVLGGEVGYNREGGRDGQSAIYDADPTRSGMVPFMDNTTISSVAERRVYLNPGVNNISVTLDSDGGGGATVMLFGGRFVYWSYGGIQQTGVFNITNQTTARTSEVSNSNYGGNARIYNCEIDNGSGDNVAIDAFFTAGNFDDGRRRLVFAPENGGNEDGECDYGGSIGGRTVTFTITLPEYGCRSVAQVVDRNGTNKAWVERLKESSKYEALCNTQAGMPSWASSLRMYDNAEGRNVTIAAANGTCSYSANNTPYGSITPPAGTEFEMMSPSEWGRINLGIPLLYRSSGANMGQLYSPSTLSYLFAESYGVWDWDDGLKTYKINYSSALNWSSPADICTNNVRPTSNNNCAVRPSLSNDSGDSNSLRLNGGANAVVLGRGFVNLTFNSQVDSQQAPLVMYEVDWGDGEKLTVSGSEMKDMPSKDYPHSAYHAYDYWDILAKSNAALVKEKMPTVICNPKDGTHPWDYCTLKPKVKVKDNWGWCSEGRDGVPCPSPSSAKCILSGNAGLNDPAAITMSNCRNYSVSAYASNPSRTCPSSRPVCSDGYYETSGEVVVYNYIGE